MTQRTFTRPDAAAYGQATRLEFSAVVKELMELLGPRLVAYIAGVRETRTVRGWAEGAPVKRGDVEPRLRMAFQMAKLIADHDGPRIAQSWFQGLNPDLVDRSPARLLREEELEEMGEILAAARGFVSESATRPPLRELIEEKREQILELAGQHGAFNVRVFGSVARGDSGPESDIDFLVELESGRSLVDQALLVEDLENLLGCKVHAVEPNALHRVIRDEILDEAVPL